MADLTATTSGDSQKKGKLRAKNSCTECQKKRKKCDEGHPCSNCKKRWTQCIYNEKRSSTKPESANRGSRVLAAATRVLAPKESSPSNTETSSDPSSLPTPPSESRAVLLPHSSSSRGARASLASRSNHAEQRDIGTSTSPASNGSPSSIAESNSTSYVDLDVAPHQLPGSDQAMIKLPSVYFHTMCVEEETLVNSKLTRSQSNPKEWMDYVDLLRIYRTMVVPSLTSIDNSETPAMHTWFTEWARFGNMSKLTTKAHLYTTAGWAHAMLPDWHAKQSMVAAEGSDDCNALVVLKLRGELLKEVQNRLAVGNVADDTISVLIPFIHEEWMKFGPSRDSKHVKGLQHMLRARGGIQKLGMNNVLAKFIILYAYHGAVTSGTVPFLPRRDRLLAKHMEPITSATMVHSPLLDATFVSNRIILGLSQEIADLLDKMSNLTSSIYEHVSGAVTTRPTIALEQARSLHDFLCTSAPICDDPLSEIVKLTSILYCRSIYTQETLSHYGTSQEQMMLMGILFSNRLPLKNWVKIPGVWLWITTVLSQAAFGRGEAIAFRNWHFNCAMNLALERWTALAICFERMLAVQKWTWKQPDAAVKLSAAKQVRSHSSVLEAFAAASFPRHHKHSHDHC